MDDTHIVRNVQKKGRTKMILRGVVVSKTITANGVFARIRIKGLPKNGSMRFFDVPDEENLEIGQKVAINIGDATIPIYPTSDFFQPLPSNEELKDAIPGCMFHGAPEPADIVGAESVVLDPLDVHVPGCESPASETGPVLDISATRFVCIYGTKV